MILFSDGIPLTKSEQASLNYITKDAGSWLQSMWDGKVSDRTSALTKDWHSELASATDSVPATTAGEVAAILGLDSYRSRKQEEAAKSGYKATDPETHRINGTRVTVPDGSRYNVWRHETVNHDSPAAVLFSSGMELVDQDVAVVEAYVVDVEDWLMGALLGQINRGKKKMIAEYKPIMLADESVDTLPTDDDKLVEQIIARSDYQAAHGS